MKIGNGACILAACLGLLAVPVACSQGPGPGGAPEVRVDKGQALFDSVWRSSGDTEVLSSGNFGQERYSPGAFRPYREPRPSHQEWREPRAAE